ncbi:MAG: YkvA family protein [Gammaproteobacteria bacterium]|nr:YkvA family protein [Gammaproteobacteria bacterium]MDH3447704.1 YkvA family protein [Gammaproteobacteria bacterium]
MRRKISGQKVEQSSFFRSARDKALDYARNPKKLFALLDRAARKAVAAKVPLAEIRESLQASIRLLRAYANGQYRDLPWESLVSIIASIVYFVMPLDLIPDFILAFGLIDDAALLGWILSSVKKDIDRFVEWEKSGTLDAPDQTRE